MAAASSPAIRGGIAGSHERVGCGSQVLGNQRSAVYLWTLCEAAQGGNISVPVATKVSFVGARATVRQLQVPSETSYAQSVRQLFPAYLQDQILQETGINFETLKASARSALSR